MEIDREFDMNKAMDEAAHQVKLDTKAEDGIEDLLTAIGEDPNREGLLDTPERVLKAYKEFTAGYQIDPVKLLATNFDLDDVADGIVYDQMIVSKDIPYSSLCEHHLLPFTGYAHVAYIPQLNGKVVGLSKLARVVDAYARRLQVQERMTQQIANTIEKVLQPRGVAVIITGKHTCQCLRGVKKDGSMVTSAMLGYFRTNETFARNELLALLELK